MTATRLHARGAACIAAALALAACGDRVPVHAPTGDVRLHPATIYDAAPSDAVYSPFNLRVEPMERLMLVNIEQDPDEVYIGFEPQVFDDPETGTGMLVIAYRADGLVDVYHHPDLQMADKDYGIVGKGLANMAERPFPGARFTVSPTGVDLYFAFDDTQGRPIEVMIREDGHRPTKPFGLLAPLGHGTAEPPYMPVFLLHDFYFVRRAGTQAHVMVDGRSHRLDRLPLPLDGRRMLFSRYSPDLLLVRWNTAHEGALTPLAPTNGHVVEHDGVFDLVDNAGRSEILRIRGGHGQRELAIDFRPAFPDITSLRDGARVVGEFTISGDPSVGTIAGAYRVARDGDVVQIVVHPSGGWVPNERRLVLRFMYARVDAFKNWPRDYLWEARVTLPDDGDPVISSGWRRLSGPSAG